MSDYIEEVFGPDGVLAKKFEGYEPRPGQVALARAVDRAISSTTHLLAEAPTGTGKSLSYLVPAIHWALLAADIKAKNSAAIIVTANIALQEQLVRKDLPLLREILPRPFTYSLLKGKNNYLCIERLENGAPGMPEAEDMEMISQIAAWGRQTTTGDKSDLPFEPPHRVWSRFAIDRDDCTGKECEFYDRCHSERARREAHKANVVVTNYHLFFSDMVVREVTGGVVQLLPSYRIAILDEGHKAVDIARDFFGFRVTQGAMKRVASMLPNEEQVELSRAHEQFFTALGMYVKSDAYASRIKKPNVVESQRVVTALRMAHETYRRMLAPLIDLEEKTTADKKRIRQLASRMDRAEELANDVEEAMRMYPLPCAPWKLHPETDQGHTPETRWYWSDPSCGGDDSVKTERQLAVEESVYFIEEEKAGPALSSRPIDVATLLKARLFARDESEGPLSVSVTSATLAVNNSFEYVGKDLGAERPSTLIADSPFSWKQQALLVLPQDVPEPAGANARDFTSAAARKCAETIELARGRTLALFTSYRNLNAAHDLALRTGYRVLKQGDMPRTKLIDEFRRDVNSVLLGTESFWAGVDVPGESLSCVFIDKLPFTTPDDPIMDALQAREPDRWFMKYSVPRAIIAFKQGFGRLIRSTGDKGVVVCCDKRLTTKFYGRQFINSLPPVQQSRCLEDVRRFLDGETLLVNPPQPGSLFG